MTRRLHEPRAPAAADLHDAGVGSRRSGSMAEARRREASRIAALSPRDRALLALDLGHRLAVWFRAAR
jgi:hypothetical protein